MPVEILAAPHADKPAFWEMLQDYIQDMTAYVDVPRVDGAFAYPYFDLYWSDANRWPFWAMVDGERVGFALVRREADGTVHMAEFYIQREHRRAGIGLPFARDVMKRFPGTWILSEFISNTPAIAFWRRVIGDWTFSERLYTGPSGIERMEQRVTVPAG